MKSDIEKKTCSYDLSAGCETQTGVNYLRYACLLIEIVVRTGSVSKTTYLVDKSDYLVDVFVSNICINNKQNTSDLQSSSLPENPIRR